MRRVTLIITLTLVAAGCRNGGIPELEGLPDSRPLGYDVDEVMYLGEDWTPEELRYIEDHGFVVTDETYRQICSCYINRDRPTFITTDSLLYAYSVNVEEGLYRLELKQADTLKVLLKGLREELRVKRGEYTRMSAAAKLDEAAADLDAYLAVAEMLTCVDRAEAIPPGTPATQRKEIELILAAEGPAVSPLRNVPLDYGRFKPRGLYAKVYPLPEELGYGPEDRALVDGEFRGSYRDLPPPPNLGGPEPEGREDKKVRIEKRTVKLGAYYRAVTWLHEVPFRVSDEDETLQALILADLDLSLGPEVSPVATFNAPYVEFLGPSDDPGITEYRELLTGAEVSLQQWGRNGGSWEKTAAALKKYPPPRHTTIPDVAAVKDPGLYAGLRFAPRPALYENEIFDALAPFGKERDPPSGEELFAVMGSRAAQEIVKNREARRVPDYGKHFPAAVLASEKAEKTYDTEICRKRRALYRTFIVTPQDPKLPRYYRHSAWRYKDLNTCLAAWAHHRYVWDLHGKSVNLYKGGGRHQQDNVVEPNVAFFRALGEFSKETDGYFTRYGVTEHRFDEIAHVAEALAVIATAQLAEEPLNSDQRRLLKTYGEVLADLCGLLSNSWLEDDDLPDTSFCVPVLVDLFTGNERVIGQARPRAIYVICEQGRRKFLAEGGVLSYRDWLGPAWGESKMTEERWLELATDDGLKAPAWQDKFYVPDEMQK